MNENIKFGNEAVTAIIQAMLAIVPKRREVSAEYRSEFGDHYSALYQVSKGLLLGIEVDYLIYRRTSPNGFLVRLHLMTDSRRMNRIITDNTPHRRLRRAQPYSKPLVRMSINHKLKNWITNDKRTQKGMGTWGSDYSLARALTLAYQMARAGSEAAKTQLGYNFDKHLAQLAVSSSTT